MLSRTQLRAYMRIVLTLLAALYASTLLADFQLPLNLDSEQSAALKAIHQAREPFDTQQVSAVLQFLSADFPDREQGYLIVRQNNLADRFLQTAATVHSTSETLLSVLDQPQINPLWREYCLQKLPLAYDELPADSAKELQARIVEQLWQQVSRSETSFSGTALLGLYRIRQPGDQAPLIAAAQHILSRKRYSLANKVTALQIAALLGDDHALKLARAWMLDQQQAISLRSSAIASVGAMGNPQDIPALQTLIQDQDLRIRNSSRAALQKLSALQ